MAEVSLVHSYPELFQVTGPPPSLVLRTEDMWQRYNQFIEASRSSQSGFPLLTPTMQTRLHGGGGGLQDSPEYKLIGCIQDHHHRNHPQGPEGDSGRQLTRMGGSVATSGFPLLTPTMQAGRRAGGGVFMGCVRCMQWLSCVFGVDT
jgi:hypothetical protein